VEINELADKIKTASKNVSRAFAFFNNHWKAYAPRNARDMIRTLQLPFNEYPIQKLPEKD
jgi:uncharacterized protein YecE (DUF72 family)